jgi:hypothetical protein
MVENIRIKKRIDKRIPKSFGLPDFTKNAMKKIWPNIISSKTYRMSNIVKL